MKAYSNTSGLAPGKSFIFFSANPSPLLKSTSRTQPCEGHTHGTLLYPLPLPLMLAVTPPPNNKPTSNRLQGANKKAICWGVLPLNPDHLNTQPEKLSTYLAPTDPARLMRARDLDSFSAGCYGVAAVGKGGSSSSPPLHTDAALAAEVCLTGC